MLNHEDIKSLINIINNTTFRGVEVETVVGLKTKLTQLLQSPETPTN